MLCSRGQTLQVFDREDIIGLFGQNVKSFLMKNSNVKAWGKEAKKPFSLYPHGERRYAMP